MNTIRLALFSLGLTLAAGLAAASGYSTGLTGFNSSHAGFAYAEWGSHLRIVAQNDFDGDGFGDLAWRNIDTGEVLVTLYKGGSPGPMQPIYTEPNKSWKIVASGDLNGDNRADLIWRNLDTGMVWGMLLNGAQIVGQGVIHYEASRNWRIVTATDFIGTGFDNQLLWANASTGDLYLHTVRWDGRLFQVTGQFIYREPNRAWQVIGAADFDGDGRADILYRNHSTGVFWMLLMNGTTVKAQGAIYQEPDLDWKILALSDYDGDQRADILWRHELTGRMYLLPVLGLAPGVGEFVKQGTVDAWRLEGPVEYPQAQ